MSKEEKLVRCKHKYSGVKTDLRETDCEDIDWNQLIHDSIQLEALVNTVISLWVLKKTGTFLTI
jgi:hypothetical protein